MTKLWHNKAFLPQLLNALKNEIFDFITVNNAFTKETNYLKREIIIIIEAIFVPDCLFWRAIFFVACPVPCT